MQDAFTIADQLLLSPFGVDESVIEKTFSRMRQHAVDYADLYFQYTRSEGWSLEEGIVKSGSFSIDQGVGVRAVAGDKTAFAYSDDIGVDAITRALMRSVPSVWPVGMAVPAASRRSARVTFIRPSTRVTAWKLQPRWPCWKRWKNWPVPWIRACCR